MWSTIAASEVDLPEPVGPVTNTRPRGRSAMSLVTCGSMRSSIVLILMGMARELRILSEPDPDEVNFLVDRYMSQRAFPEDKRDDAAHVAIVVLSPAIEAMISWNCRHLANEYNRRRLKALTLAEGYSFHFDIITPEEALSYE